MSKKIIIKLGTASIFDKKKNKLKKRIISNLARDISKLIKKDFKIIVVSSGAVGCGRNLVMSSKENISLKQSQAAMGQVKLINEYSRIFKKYNLNIAQFLINFDDLTKQEKIKNIKNTYKNFNKNTIPLLNENDVTSTLGLEIGDNDILSSRFLINMDFDLLLILTEKGALIKNNKKLKKSGFFRAEDYDKIDIPLKGFGGLQSKLDVAKELVNKNKKCIIARAGDSIIDILNKKVISTEFFK